MTGYYMKGIGTTSKQVLGAETLRVLGVDGQCVERGRVLEVFEVGTLVWPVGVWLIVALCRLNVTTWCVRATPCGTTRKVSS